MAALTVQRCGAVMVLALALAPACLLAPPRPGETGDGGTGDGGTGSCGCADDPDARLPFALVAPAPTPGADGQVLDRLVRAGTCYGRAHVLVHEPDEAGAFSPRCPTRMIEVPDFTPADPVSPRVRAVVLYDANAVAVFVDVAGPEAGDPTQIQVHRIPLDGAVANLLITGSMMGALPDAPGYLGFTTDPPTFLLGAGDTVWSGTLPTVPLTLTSAIAPPPPVFTAVAPQRLGAAVSDAWGSTGPSADYLSDLGLTSLVDQVYVACTGCPRIAHADHTLGPLAGDVLAYSITAGSDLSLIVRGQATSLRTQLSVAGQPQVLDAAIRTQAGQTRIAILGDTGSTAGYVLALTTLALTPSNVPTILPDVWATAPLAPPIEGAARVLVGRFGGLTPRVIAVSDQPGGDGRRDACVQPGPTAFSLVPCE